MKFDLIMRIALWNVLFCLCLGLLVSHTASGQQCHTPDNDYRIHSNHQNRYGDCVEVYIECDFATYQALGSVANTEQWVNEMMSGVIDLYADIGVPISVSEIEVWTSASPYESESTLSTTKNQFINHIGDNYNGRIAIQLTTRDLGGGLAHGIGGICGSAADFPGPYAVMSGLASSFPAYPSYSYNVYLLAHEIGHILGARHTHACLYNNNNTQIDDCGNWVANMNNNTPEGQNCFDSLNPILPTFGTIMSTCQDAMGSAIDFSTGFHPEIASTILAVYNSADCFTGNLCESITPSNNNCSGAINIPVSNLCRARLVDNYNATASNTTPAISCGNNNLPDVWYKVAVPSNGRVQIESTSLGSLSDMLIQVYTGNCNTLSLLACDDNSGTGNHASVLVDNHTPGDTLLIRVIEKNGGSGTFGICAHSKNIECHPDYNDLLDIYNLSNGASWTNNAGWATADDVTCNPCQWYGVVCNGLDRVIELNLRNNNLSGSLSPSLGNLSYLKKIDFWNHSMSGAIPDIFIQLPALEYLDLSNGAFSGNMPDFTGLNALHTLYLESNQLTGPLRPEIGNLSAINIFWAKNNQLSGCIPTTYSQLCNIQSVQLQNNEALPSDGDFSLYCTQGLGLDNDNDGYCSGIDIDDDCDDTRNTIYPNAPELCDGFDNDCDGSVDEGLVTTNTWIGTNGNWQDDSNWSLMHAPLPCEHVIINNAAVQINTGAQATARSITLQGNAYLTNQGSIVVRGSDQYSIRVEQAASLSNEHNVEIFSISGNALELEGNIINIGNAVISHRPQTPHLLIINNGLWSNGTSAQLQLLDY